MTVESFIVQKMTKGYKVTRGNGFSRIVFAGRNNQLVYLTHKDLVVKAIDLFHQEIWKTSPFFQAKMSEMQYLERHRETG
jgi:uncharacterized membrane protein